MNVEELLREASELLRARTNTAEPAVRVWPVTGDPDREGWWECDGTFTDGGGLTYTDECGAGDTIYVALRDLIEQLESNTNHNGGTR